MASSLASTNDFQRRTNQWAILQCKPCAIYNCEKQTRCNGGKLRDACNCCDVCAKVEGEICGGKLYKLGRCDKGLSCDISGSTYPFPIGKCVGKNNSRT